MREPLRPYLLIQQQMKILRYGNKNTYYVPRAAGGLLIDTDLAGSLPQFFKAVKAAGISVDEIAYRI